MTNHLKACHKEEAKSLVKEEGPKQSILHHFVATTDKKVKKWPKSTEKWKELTLALAIIYGKLPFEYTYGFLERIND